jgi:hypothetical protein
MKQLRMRRIRSLHLILAVVFISMLSELSRYAFVPEDRVSVAHLLIVLNVLVGIAGLWTSYRVGWIAYLVASVALAILIGAVTPVSAVGIFVRLIAP